MKLPVALLLIVTVVVGCEKTPQATSAPAKPEDVPAKPAPPPPPAPPVVGEDTLREVNAVNEKIKESVPITSADTEDQRPDETTADYQQRIRTANRKVAKFNNEWRKCFVGRSDMGYVPASDMPLSKFVRESKISFKWECAVFDIMRGPNGGDQVLCSTATATDWSYAVLGYLPKRHGLRKGSVIRFERLNTCMPAEGSALKIKLLNMDDNNLKFAVVDPTNPGAAKQAEGGGESPTPAAPAAPPPPKPRSAPAVSLGEVEVGGGLDQDEVRKVAQGNLSQIRFCYEAAVARNPSLAGRVTVNLTVSANGPAVRSTDQEMNTPTPDLEICVAGRVKTWAFPKAEGGDPVKVALAFSFR